MAILGHIMVLWPKYSEYRHQNWYISYIIYSLLVQEFIKRLKGVQNLNCQNSENGRNGQIIASKFKKSSNEPKNGQNCILTKNMA